MNEQDTGRTARVCAVVGVAGVRSAECDVDVSTVVISSDE